MPKVTFLPDGNTIEVPAGRTILDAAQASHTQVGHACGGNCACSTCHVYVQQGYATLYAIDDDEEDILDKAFDVKVTSRLACQAKVGTSDLICEITRESRQAWLDEHPEERAKIKAQKAEAEAAEAAKKAEMGA